MLSYSSKVQVNRVNNYIIFKQVLLLIKSTKNQDRKQPLVQKVVKIRSPFPNIWSQSPCCIWFTCLERRPGDLREPAFHLPALHLLRHSARWFMLRQLWGQWNLKGYHANISIILILLIVFFQAVHCIRVTGVCACWDTHVILTGRRVYRHSIPDLRIGFPSAIVLL